MNAERGLKENDLNVMESEEFLKQWERQQNLSSNNPK